MTVSLKKWIIAAFVCMAVFAMLSLSACSTSEQEQTNAGESDTITLVNQGSLTVAASLDFPPFESQDDEGAPVGFAVDLMNEVASRLNLECTYLPTVKFDSIIPMVQAGGKADVGVSSFTITPERAEQIDFSDSYCDSNQGIVVIKGAYTNIDDLKGKKIGAQSGTTGLEWAQENIEGAEVIAYDEVTAIFAALDAGQIDAIAVDLPVAQSYVKNSYTGDEIIAEIPTGEQYGMVISKDNPALTKAINEALAAMRADGTYEEIYNKHFGV